MCPYSSGGKPIRVLPDSEIVSGPDIEVRNWSGKSAAFPCKMIISYGFWLRGILYSAYIRRSGTLSAELPEDEDFGA